MTRLSCERISKDVGRGNPEHSEREKIMVDRSKQNWPTGEVTEIPEDDETQCLTCFEIRETKPCPVCGEPVCDDCTEEHKWFHAGEN